MPKSHLINFDDEDSADVANSDSAICGFARPLQSGLSGDSILRGGGGGEMVSFTDIVVRGKMRHATPVTACLAIYITSCTSSTYFSASGNSERLRPLMEHNNRDVCGGLARWH